MSQQPQASAATGAIAVAGNVGGSIVNGDKNTVVNDNHGAIVFNEAPLPVKRKNAKLPAPREPLEFFDRVSELTQINQLIPNNKAVTIYGPDGAGKSTLLRKAANSQAARALPDGVLLVEGVDIDGKTLGPDDVIQRMYDSLYESTPPRKVDATSARPDLAKTRPLVMLDGVAFPSIDALRSVLDLFPNSPVLIALPGSPGSNATRLIKLSALPHAEAIALLAAEIGVPVDDGNRSAFDTIGTLLADAPLAMVTTANVIREKDLPLDRVRETLSDIQPGSTDAIPMGIERAYGLAYSVLTDNERRLLHAIGALPGVSVDPDMLVAIVGGALSIGSAELRIVREGDYIDIGGVRLHVRDHGIDAPVAPQSAPVNADWVAAAIERLKMLGLLHANSPRLRLDPGFRPLARAGSDETAIKDRLITQLLRDALLSKMRDWSYCAAELGNILGAIDWAVAQQRWNDVIALSRAIDPYLTLHGLWNAWVTTLNRVLQAARAINDRANEAWALHQLGTHALCIGQTRPATDQLRQALELRRTLGDTIGMAYTQHNLDLLIAPPIDRSKPQTPREPKPAPKAAAAGGLGFFKSLLIVIVVLGLLAGGALFSGGFITGLPTLNACNRDVPASSESAAAMARQIEAAKGISAGQQHDLQFNEAELTSYVRVYTEQTGSLIDGKARLMDADGVVICGQNVPLGNLPIVARFRIVPGVDQPFELESVALHLIDQPGSTFGWVALPNVLAASFTDQVKQLLGNTYRVIAVNKIDDATWRITIEGK